MKKLLILLLFLSITSAYTQVSQQWVSRYSASGGNDSPTDMAIDAAGNVYITGISIVNSTSSDFLTIKYNAAGVQQWESRFIGNGGSNNDEAYSIGLDASGNVYVGGTSFGGGTSLDIMIVKYSNSGSVIWEVRYTNAEAREDEIIKMIVDGAGNVYVGGISTYAATQKDFVVLKYNSAGQLQWARTYNNSGNNNDYLSNLAVDASGNVYATGSSYVPGNSSDFVTLKYNSAGTLQYAYSLNVGGDEVGTEIAVDGSGNAYVSGYTDAYGTGFDFFTYSLSTTGSFRWLHRYNGGANAEDRPQGIIVDPSGNVYVAGFSNQGATGFDLLTVKYNSSGVEQWVRPLNVGGDDRAYDMSMDAGGNLYLAGKTNAYGTGDDFLSCSYNSNGDFRWLMAYNNAPTNGNDYALKILADASGNIVVTGASSGGANDYATIKYSSITGMQPLNNEIPGAYSIDQNYPNPFNPETQIQFSIPEQGAVKLAIYDINGKEVAKLVDADLAAGVYSYRFNASALSSGMYFYRITAGSFTETKKMILIK